MISCLVHTYNEAKNLGRCLQALEFADEIVVIDMGSTDKTLEIARDFKAKIYQHPYTGYVEPARNFGIKKAKGDWILIVDSDEFIPPDLVRVIKNRVNSENNEINYYRIARKNIIFNNWMKNSGWWPDYQIRLFKKGSVSWSEKIHGIPVTRGIGGDFMPDESQAIVHYNYTSVSEFLERANRYSAIQASEFYSKNKRIEYSDFILSPVNEFVKRYLNNLIW